MMPSLRVLFLEVLFAFLPRILAANRFLSDMLFHLEISKKVCRLGPIVALILGPWVGMLFMNSCGRNTEDFLLLARR